MHPPQDHSPQPTPHPLPPSNLPTPTNPGSASDSPLGPTQDRSSASHLSDPTQTRRPSSPLPMRQGPKFACLGHQKPHLYQSLPAWKETTTPPNSASCFRTCTTSPTRPTCSWNSTKATTSSSSSNPGMADSAPWVLTTAGHKPHLLTGSAAWADPSPLPLHTRSPRTPTMH